MSKQPFKLRWDYTCGAEQLGTADAYNRWVRIGEREDRPWQVDTSSDRQPDKVVTKSRSLGISDINSLEYKTCLKLLI
ncbi:terminase large subunit [Bacillus phage SIOphi]|uniref:Uncharacterized protein n=1 Tax=Bacillus phage SIOphi TaxID=1285382 RepID=R4JGQ5_9CAUD|nr:terminase large subunit [Bacillus phage SIOphi]AGK86971.1 hypothetical protein SIOphi_00815 [Bacillus phage SIOphi]